MLVHGGELRVQAEGQMVWDTIALRRKAAGDHLHYASRWQPSAAFALLVNARRFRGCGYERHRTLARDFRFGRGR